MVKFIAHAVAFASGVVTQTAPQQKNTPLPPRVGIPKQIHAPYDVKPIDDVVKPINKDDSRGNQ